MSDGKIEGHGSRDEGNPDHYHGEQGEPERNAVIEHPMTIKVDDPAFFLPGLQTRGTEVFPAQFYVAQGAQESSAMVARDDGFFLGMIKAARLIIHQGLSRFPGLKSARKGGKRLDLDRHMTGRAWDKIRGVVVLRGNRRMALCTENLFHGGYAFFTTLVSQMRSWRARFSSSKITIR
jgi:hypothetical protein